MGGGRGWKYVRAGRPRHRSRGSPLWPSREMSSKFFAKMGAKTTLSRTTCLRFFVGLKPLGIVHGSNLQPGSSRYRAFDIHGMNGAAILQPIEPPVLTVELERAAGPYIK